MKTNFIFILIITLFTLSLNAQEVKNIQKQENINSYVAFEKLHENMYMADNEDFILGLGINLKSSDKLNFIFAYEGDIYNEKTNSSFIYPADKLASYIKGGGVSYKLNYKF